MLFSRFAILPSLAFAASLPRDILPTGQIVKQDVINIHNAVLALDNTINSYQGVPLPTSLVEGTPVLLGVAEIHKVNRAGFRHALAALPFTVEDSRDVIDAVVDTGTYRSIYFSQELIGSLVNVSIPKSTQDLKAKVDAFKQGGLVPVVVASLTLLLSDHDTFSAATLVKIDQAVGSEKIKQGEDAVANIHNAIADAIKFYAANLV